MDKKLEAKRLFIYLALSFGLAWGIFFAFILSGNKWDGSNQYMEQLVGLGMLMPLVAHVLTRWISKEGFAMTGKDSLMLGISFKNKKWIYYLFALFVPWVYFEVSQLFTLIFVPTSFDTSILDELGYGKGIAFVFPIITITSCTIVSFAALGEEGGWRGYMMPKLIKLIGLPKSIVVGGIIWGLWHAPLTCVGHNFGTTYPGFPYLGIIFMCIWCTLIGIMLTYITIKTQSVWPAAIMHAVNNGNPSILRFFVNLDVLDQSPFGIILYFAFMSIPLLVISLVIIAIEVKKYKSEKGSTSQCI